VLTTQCDVAYPPVTCLSTAPLHVNAWKAVTYDYPALTDPGTGDMDCDGVVCGYDFPPFTECMTGPGGGPVMGFCLEGDFGSSPPDGDVDLRDLYSFQLAFEGAGSGACCHPDGTCSVVSMYDCASEEEAVYNGNDTTCADTACIMTRYANGADTLDQGYQSSGPGKQLADDVTLTGSGGGLLTHYELLVYGGTGGTFNVTAELYDACPGEGGNAIGGTQHTTQRTFNGNPDGQAVLLSADFDPPVYIPQQVWMVLTFSTSQAGWFLAEEAEIGYTADHFARYAPPWVCSYYYGGEPYAGLWALIECAKVTGACCKPDQTCIEGTEADCSAVSGVYQGHGTTCAQVDCSASACCLRDGTCISTTQANCTTLNGTFHPQIACENPALDCTPTRYSNTAPVDYYRVEGATQFADDLTPTLGGYLIHYDTKVCRPSGGSYTVTVSLHTGCPPGNEISGTAHAWNLSGTAVQTLNFNFPPVFVSGTVWMRVQFSATNVEWVVADQAEIGYTQDVFAAYDGYQWWCGCTIQGHWSGFWAHLTFGAGLDGPPEPFAWVESEIPPVPPRPIAWTTGGGDNEPTLAEPPFHLLPSGGLRPPAPLRYGQQPREPRGGTVLLYLTSSVANQTIAPGTPVDWTISALVSTGDNSGLALISTALTQDDVANPSLFDIPPATSIGPQMAVFDRPAGISNPGPSGSAFGGTPSGTPGAQFLVQIGGAQNTFGMPGVECGLETTVTPGIGQSGPVIVASGSFPAPTVAGGYTFRLAAGLATVLNVMPPPTPPAHWPVSAATTNLTNGSFSFTVETACVGDLNCDGTIGFGDINPFVLYQSNFANWQATFPGCNPLNGDINCDGTYGQAAFGDINPFVALMNQCGMNCTCPGPIVCP
jgi:hypothetical protein